MQEAEREDESASRWLKEILEADAVVIDHVRVAGDRPRCAHPARRAGSHSHVAQASVAGEHRLGAVLRERHRVEVLLHPALLHTGRAHGHAADADARDRRLLFQQALDVLRRHVTFDHVAADFGRVTGLQIGRHTGLNLGRRQLRVADISGFHLEAARPDVFDPGATAASRGRLVHHH